MKPLTRLLVDYAQQLHNLQCVARKWESEACELPGWEQRPGYVGRKKEVSRTRGETKSVLVQELARRDVKLVGAI